jgi:xylan 1,4-beta-xylosidase
MRMTVQRFVFAVLFGYAFAIAPSTAFAQPAATRTISVDYRRVKGPRDPFPQLVVGAGRAAEGLRADWQRDLALVHRECGFKYVRFHGLLQDELGVYSEDKQGKPVYNFQYIDVVYDAILTSGMRPFVEFGFMPQGLASGAKTIFWWKGNITPPRDYGKWEALIRTLVQHWTNRYGRDELRHWYFEVWNEPNLKDLFWSGDQTDYFKLYDATVRAVKSVSADYRVGGPATAGRAWVPEMIGHATKTRIPLDFITTHDYGVRGGALDADGTQQLFLDPSLEAIIAGVREVHTQIKTSTMPNLPLHYTEWSASYSPRDPVHDSYISAAYILSRLKGIEGHAASMSYWTFTDIFEESGPVPSPFHGGFGLSQSNQIYFKRDLRPQNVGDVRVSLRALPPGHYTLNVYRVGYGVNDVYTDYLRMGSPATLTREQVKALAERNDGRPGSTEHIRVGTSGKFERVFAMRENDVYLLILQPARTKE